VDGLVCEVGWIEVLVEWYEYWVVCRITYKWVVDHQQIKGLREDLDGLVGKGLE
jgi:hypothetical protein